MSKSVYRRTGLSTLKQAVIPLLFTAAILVLVVIGLGETERQSRDEGRRLLEESIRRAVVQSFAIEGRYAPSVLHLERYYGVFVDRDRYAVSFRAFARNIMPEIFVHERLR